MTEGSRNYQSTSDQTRVFSAAKRGFVLASISSNAKKSRLPFASVHVDWFVKINHNSSCAPGWSGLVAIVWALAPRELGGSSWVGRWNVGGLCTVQLCCYVMSVVAVAVVAVAVVLFVYVCMRVLVCSVIQEVWCSVRRAGCLPPAATFLW